MNINFKSYSLLFRKALKNKWVKATLVLAAVLIGLFFIFYGSIYFGFWGKIATSEELSSLQQAEATQVLDRNEDLIGKYYIYDRQPVQFADLPQHLIDALIATEDARFFEHDGIDNKSLLRVFFKTILLQDKSSGGGSTITLQLAKNLFGRNDYGLFSLPVNKLKESIVASRLEDIYSKNELLTLYFNTVPFSDNTYGIESAAHKFFNKSTQELNLSEAATLIGTLKANHSYNPRLFPERSQLRRDVVLQQMVKYDYLDAAKAKEIMNTSITLDYQFYDHNQGLAPYFRQQVKKDVEIILSDLKKPDGSPYDIYKDGLVIHTTLDSKLQTLAEASMSSHLRNLQQQYEKAHGKIPPWKNKTILNQAIQNSPVYKRFKAEGLSEAQIKDSLSQTKSLELFEWDNNITTKGTSIDSIQHYMKFLNTGMLSINPKDGAVLAYIGGIDYRYFKYDHISQSERQIGSTMKPFVYTTAIENGMDPCTYYSIKEVTYSDYEDWTPQNASEQKDPYLNYTLEKALSNSINTIAVKVLQDTGIENVHDMLRALGIEKKLSKEPSMVLGIDGIKLIDLAGAYASYVNAGKSVSPYYITKITDRNGSIIAEFNPKIAKNIAFKEYTRQVMVQMLQNTVANGTATRLRTEYKLTNDIAGKTGTTQDNKDGWFVGITPRLVTVTWVGNDNYNIGFPSTSLGQGANSALPIFAKLYQQLNKDNYFDKITKAKFIPPTPEVLADLDCEPEKRDGFLKRLFGKKKKEKKFTKN
ncbi:transglycosylase domain-containing protein [Aquimarina brevivitae]|uniref:Penicillin-binding protein 1A n=1 Tax=Aquimarina brevivitae TaxID=323412 RepID=A0A4Q7PJ06_9FLAO|nr:transglycosylase domain-containing protein [Aquimarina brevivitae]RZT00258.1 penicillin-binding protein 1A [Aquimarina brevivitae]